MPPMVGPVCQARSKCLAKGDVTSRFSEPQKSRKYSAKPHLHAAVPSLSGFSDTSFNLLVPVRAHFRIFTTMATERSPLRSHRKTHAYTF